MASIARNDPCHCGSGQKYKRCCIDKADAQKKDLKIPLSILAISVVLAAALFFVKGMEWAGVALGGGLILSIISAVAKAPPPPREDGARADSINFGN